jgi:dihydroxy-acid dehydratase
MLVAKDELAKRKKALEKASGYKYPEHQTPWQEIFRSLTDQLADGMVLKPAVKYQRVAQTFVPRDNH